MTFDQAKRYLLDQAEARDIDVEVLVTENRELTLGSFEGGLAELTQASQGGLGVRVVTGGKTGYASTEERTPEALDWVLDEAVENAGLQSATDGFLPKGQRLEPKDLLGEGLSAPLDEKGRKARDLEAGLRTDHRTKQVPITRYTERETRSSLASTRGVSGGYRNGYALLVASLVMQQGESLKQGFDVEVEKEFHSLDPGRTSLKILERTGRLLGARPLATGRYRAYLEPIVMGQLLGVLAFSINGRNLIEGKSRLAGRLGQRVASDTFDLIDDPTLPTGLASRPFDSEGTPARRVTIIERGILKSFLHNSQTAARSGQENTGHAARSYRSTLGVATSNLFLQPGAGIVLEDGVQLSRVMGLHAGANPITGDFSLQGLGLRIEGGEVAYPVENFAVSGNLFQLLEAVTAVGTDLEWSPLGGVTGSPMVEVAELSFAGT